MEPSHFIIKLESQKKAQLLQRLASQSVLLYYHHKWCAFQFKEIKGSTESPSFIYLAVTLNHAFLHVGQFKTGQIIEFYREGYSFASGEIVEITDPSMEYWCVDPVQKQCFTKQPWIEKLTHLMQSWEKALATSQNQVYVKEDKSSLEFTIIQPKHNSMTLTQAYKIVQMVNDTPYATDFRLDYLPLAYGTMELFLKNFVLTFVITIDNCRITGDIRTKKMTLCKAS